MRWGPRSRSKSHALRDEFRTGGVRHGLLDEMILIEPSFQDRHAGTGHGRMSRVVGPADGMRRAALRKAIGSR